MPEPAENKMPTRRASMVFRGKALCLQARRGTQDFAAGLKPFPCLPSDEIASHYSCILAHSRTALYTEAHLAEQRLQLGKVQNLRCALRHLHGLTLPAGATFSFWQQVGRATRARGYVPGRQLREGCLFPAIGGGLCQLSNALYDLALQAGGEIIERHPHTRIVPNSAAEAGRDAAVAWNYIDLRFRFTLPVCLEATLTRDELILRLRVAEEDDRKEEEKKRRKGDVAANVASSHAPVPASASTSHFVPLVVLASARRPLVVEEHSCVTCGASRCFRHDSAEVKALREQSCSDTPAGRAVWLLDETMPELAAYVGEQRSEDDWLMLPLNGRQWNKPGYAWPMEGWQHVVTATLPTLWRAYQLRSVGADGPARRRAQLAGSAQLAAYFARRLPWDASHVVVAQSLLPTLWRTGHLGGRTFDVLMHGLPMQTLQARLDQAYNAKPERALLNDYRAAATLVREEWEALQAARHIVTPHSEVAALFPTQAQKLDWQLPCHNAAPFMASATVKDAAEQHRAAFSGRTIAFPGPTHARKGAYEVRSVARALNLEVVLLGSELEGPDFWRGVNTRRVSRQAQQSGADWLEDVSVVVQPAIVEEKPRRLLEALARGVPVIATPACGLHGMPNVTTIAVDDEAALRDAILNHASLKKALCHTT